VLPFSSFGVSSVHAAPQSCWPSVPCSLYFRGKSRPLYQYLFITLLLLKRVL
jgi:hypothetical protein